MAPAGGQGGADEKEVLMAARAVGIRCSDREPAGVWQPLRQSEGAGEANQDLAITFKAGDLWGTPSGGDHLAGEADAERVKRALPAQSGKGAVKGFHSCPLPADGEAQRRSYLNSKLVSSCP